MRQGAAERRSGTRRRTRLRPGKLLDGTGRFLADCAILDRSKHGARIRLFERLEVTGLLRLLDERERASVAIEPVWQHRGQAGLRLSEEAEPMASEAFREASGPYYAVR